MGTCAPERLTPAEENERLANCTHDEVPALPGATCAVCGADLAAISCAHVWPAELDDEAACTECLLPYKEFEVRS